MKGIAFKRVIVGGVAAGLILVLSETMMNAIVSTDAAAGMSQTALRVAGQGGLGIFLFV